VFGQRVLDLHDQRRKAGTNVHKQGGEEEGGKVVV